MNAIISIEDALLAEADRAVRDLGLSHSGLIAEALREYLLRRRQARISDQLNQARTNRSNPDERRLVRMLNTKLQPQTVGEIRWRKRFVGEKSIGLTLVYRPHSGPYIGSSLKGTAAGFRGPLAVEFLSSICLNRSPWPR